MTLPATITPERARKIDASVGPKLEEQSAASLQSSVGGQLDPSKLATLQKSVALALRSSLAASLGLRADVSAGGGAAVAGGVSLGDSLGSQASVAAQSSAGTALGASISTALDVALVGLGLSASEQAAIKADVRPQLNQAADKSLKRALGASPGYSHAGGARVLSSETTLHVTGPWRATVVLDLEDDEELPAGPFTFEIEGVEHVGTIIPSRSGAFGGRFSVYVVGGAGGIDQEFGARNYAAGVIRVRTVVDDILRDSGETLSSESDSALLDRQLTNWQRSSGTAGQALTHLLEPLGANWRVLRDGTVWVGFDTWPEVEPDGILMDEHWGEGYMQTAPDSPTHVPGVTVRGKRVEQVTHRVDHRGLRTELHQRSTRGILKKFSAEAERKSLFGFRYQCRVVRQLANGRVDVEVDDPRMKAKGVGNCAIRVGIPGTTVAVPKGARCLVGWDGGDPNLPYVDGWESGTAFTTIDIG